MKVRVNQNLCIGAGNCAQLAANVFTQREQDGIVVLNQEKPPAELQDAVMKAVKNCPSGAISVSED